jgi:hypothetical protein
VRTHRGVDIVTQRSAAQRNATQRNATDCRMQCRALTQLAQRQPSLVPQPLYLRAHTEHLSWQHEIVNPRDVVALQAPRDDFQHVLLKPPELDCARTATRHRCGTIMHRHAT